MLAFTCSLLMRCSKFGMRRPMFLRPASGKGRTVLPRAFTNANLVSPSICMAEEQRRRRPSRLHQALRSSLSLTQRVSFFPSFFVGWVETLLGPLLLGGPFVCRLGGGLKNGLLCCPRVSQGSGGPGRETQNCRRFWSRLLCSHLRRAPHFYFAIVLAFSLALFSWSLFRVWGLGL